MAGISAALRHQILRSCRNNYAARARGEKIQGTCWALLLISPLPSRMAAAETRKSPDQPTWLEIKGLVVYGNCQSRAVQSRDRAAWALGGSEP